MITAIFFAILAKLTISPLFNDTTHLQSNSIALYTPDALIIISACFALTRKKPTKSILKAIACMLIAVSTVITSSIINEKPIAQAIQNLLKTISPLLLLLATLSIAKEKNSLSIYKHTKALSISIILLTILGFLFLPPSLNRGKVWLPAYFSGLHTSAYVILGGLLCAYSCYKFNKSNQNKLILLFYGTTTLSLLLTGWGVRTGVLSLLMFAISIHLSRIKIDPLATLIISTTLSVALTITIISLELISYQEFDFFTSGRLSMYSEKIQFLSNYNVYEWLFGKGYGSDLMLSSIWWWAEKGSHNDFLTFLTENGMTFLASLAFMIFIFYYKILKKPEQKAVMVIIVLSSLVSNGYLVRPLPFYCIIFPLALFALTSKNTKITPT